MDVYRRVLAMDTSTHTQALALIEGDEQIARRHHLTRGNHADTLLHNIHDMLGQHAWTLDSIDLVACGLGPGSFTGLRVGLANAKALAFAAGAALGGVSSLAAIARPVTALHQGPVLVAVDARRLEVYAGVYVADERGLHAIRVDQALSPALLMQWISELPEVVVVGGGFQAYFADDSMPGHARLLDSAWNSPSPFSVGTMARAHVLQAGPGDLVTLEPNYIRPSDAESNLAARLKP